MASSAMSVVGALGSGCADCLADSYVAVEAVAESLPRIHGRVVYLVVMMSSPPERLHLDRGELTRLRETDGVDMADAVQASLSHLKPWMSWATEAAVEPAAQRARSRDIEQQWERGSDYIYVLRPYAAGPVVGTFGLHRRIGRSALEISYWLRPDHLGRGYATAAAAALTKAALDLPGVDRVEIHTVEANMASAAIPRRLNYRLHRIEKQTPLAPAETGRKQIWVTP